MTVYTLISCVREKVKEYISLENGRHPPRHKFIRLSPVCITALSAVYCSSYLSVCVTAKNSQSYREKASQFMMTGVPSLLYGYKVHI